MHTLTAHTPTSRWDGNAESSDDTTKRLSALLTRVGGGDRDAFTDFYDATAPHIHGVALRLLRNATLAEDVAQETYLQVWTTAGRYDPERGSPLSWVTTIAHRRSVDRIRREERYSRYTNIYAMCTIVRDYDIVVETVEKGFDERRVAAGLARLTERQREAIELVYYGGKTHPQLAEALHVGVPAAKSRVRDALVRLKGLLGEPEQTKALES